MMSGILLLVTIGIALLNTTWLSDLSIAGGKPDLILIIVTYYAHERGVQRGQIGGFLAGVIEDILSASPLGFFAVVRMLHGGALGFTQGSIRGDAILTPILLVTIASVVRYVAIALLAMFFRLEALFGPLVSLVTLIEFSTTVVLAPVAFMLLNAIARRVTTRSGLS